MANDVFGYMQDAGCKGRLTLSVNPFIPKPFTPFQWMPMANQKEVTKKLNSIKKALGKNRRIEVLVESPKEAIFKVCWRAVIAVWVRLLPMPLKMAARKLSKTLAVNLIMIWIALYIEKEN